MTLTPGTRLGVYDIIAPIGEGGMGQVYRATDTTLGRQVAIKILPDAFAKDPERLARFEREAKTLASLNHPHIASIYGFEKSAGLHALVMELVEGEDLSQRLAGGAIPIDEALPIARQIAEALEASHEQGIIHRDLKPANIKVRADGTVKVLDFGLAKAVATGASGGIGATAAKAAQSPTFTSPAALTMGGMILGTAAYMAPEQARGKAVDKRADIWSFGLVLYEMLTGRAAFAGDTVTDILAAVVTREPDWSVVPATTPASITRLLTRCAEKDPRRRLRDIGDARMEIDHAIALESGVRPAGESSVGPPSTAGATPGQKIAWAGLGSTLAAVAPLTVVVSGIWPRQRPVETRALSVSIVHTEGSEVAAPAISPDGRQVAYRARRADGIPVRLVTDHVSPWTGYGGTWAADGTIAFGGQEGLFRVQAEGGAAAVKLVKLPSGDWAHYWPSVLPDGRRFLFTAKLFTRAAEASEQGIYLGSLDSPTIVRLLPDLSSAVYAPPGYLVFAREGTLTAAPFDLAAGRVTGPPVVIGGAVATDTTYNFAAISASADGTIAVRPPPAAVLVFPDANTFNAELHLADRSGARSRVGAARLFSQFMSFSPADSRTLMTTILDPRAGTQDLWMLDLTRDSIAPQTTTRGFAGSPVWSADGKRLAYTYQPPGQRDDVYVTDVATGGIQPVIETPDIGEHPIAWSHDGASLLVFTYDDRTTYLSTWSFASRTLTRFAGPNAVEAAAFSPKDDYVAFTSQETGRPEVSVTTFPDRRQTWSVTTDGGRVLGWKSDGREILVATLSGHIVAYPVSMEGGFSRGQATTLVRDVGGVAAYSAATPDHSRILIRVSPDAAKDKGEIRLLFHWQDGLRQPSP